MAEVKAKLLAAGRAALKHEGEPLNGILLYGAPGNGKTVLAEGLAGELGLPFISISIADIKSRWVAQTTEQLVEGFRDAVVQAPCLLLIDEVDSVISNREGSGGNSSEEGLATTNAFLTEVVRVRGAGVVVVVATNFFERLDPAAIREGRFDFKIEVTAPDQAAREGLLRDGLARGAPEVICIDPDIAAVARRWEGFSVARLRAVARAVAGAARSSGTRHVSREDFVAGLRAVQAQHTPSVKVRAKCRNCYFHTKTVSVSEGIAWRMKAPFEAEDAGASVPDGLLLYGPPGTGKSEAVRSLADSTGWPLICESGARLAADPERVRKLRAQALDQRR